MTFFFDVDGVPVPQGSMRGFRAGSRVILTSDNKKTRPWKDQVRDAVRDLRGDSPPLSGPVRVMLTFCMPRPKYHLDRHGAVRADAPSRHDKKPDVDKLSRAVLDALTEAGVWKDDSQVAELDAVKLYTDGGGKPGLHGMVREV